MDDEEDPGWDWRDWKDLIFGFCVFVLVAVSWYAVFVLIGGR